MPDAFSRTIPIWAAVLNRVVQILRTEIKTSTKSKLETDDNDDTCTDMFWDTKLYTPRSCVTEEEHEMIERLLDDRAQMVLSSGVILDPEWLIHHMKRPLRPYWITNDNDNYNHPTNNSGSKSNPMDSIVFPDYSSQHINIVCVSCSTIMTSNNPSKPHEMDYNPTNQTDTDTDINILKSYNCGNKWHYSPGAADDHESWARGLTPYLFWSHFQSILYPDVTACNSTISQQTSSTINTNDAELVLIQGTKKTIDEIVKQAKKENEEWYLDDGTTNKKQHVQLQMLGISNPSPSLSSSKHLHHIRTFSSKDEEDISGYYSMIGCTNLFIGSRRAGRPPQCWNHFDAIVNVTMNEYPEMKEITNGNNSFYLQMPVLEGKRDRTQLEHWMAVAMVFIMGNLNKGRKVLIHCAQGKDRSVAVIMAVLALFFHIEEDENDRKVQDTQDMNFEPISSSQTFVSWKMERCFQKMTLEEMESLAWCIDDANIDRRSSDSNDDNSDDNIENRNDKTGENIDQQTHENNLYEQSGLSKRLVELLRGREGRNLLFSWISQWRQTSMDDMTSDSRHIHEKMKPEPSPSLSIMTSKESLRLALHFIQTYREQVSPTRNTLQKLNRFLMSGSYEH